jgi:hypothetical protein
VYVPGTSGTSGAIRMPAEAATIALIAQFANATLCARRR